MKRAEFLEHFVNVHQSSPVSIRILGVVRLVRLILIKANRVWNLDRHRPNLYFDSQAVERSKYFLIKVCHCLWPQRERLQRTIAALDAQLVVDEVEFDLKDAIVVRHGRSLQSARRNI